MIPVLMPKLNFDMTSGTVASWLKHIGDRVKRGEVLFEVEMDKGVIEVEALTAGTLVEVLGNAGLEIPVGQPVAYLAEE